MFFSSAEELALPPCCLLHVECKGGPNRQYPDLNLKNRNKTSGFFTVEFFSSPGHRPVSFCHG